MSDEQLLSDLRARFDMIATDVPNRQRLAAQLREIVEPPRTRPLLAAAAAVALLVIGGFVAVSGFGSGGPDAVDVAAERVLGFEAAIEPDRPSGRRFASTLSGSPVDLALPDVTNGRWSVTADTDALVELTLTLAAESSGEDPALRLFIVPDLDAREVANQLVSGLFDTDVLSESQSQLGDLKGIKVAMASRQGTSRVAFRLGAETYVETVGIDRRYLVHIFTRPSGSFVVWLDAAQHDFNRARGEADRLRSSIVLGD